MRTAYSRGETPSCQEQTEQLKWSWEVSSSCSTSTTPIRRFSTGENRTRSVTAGSTVVRCVSASPGDHPGDGAGRAQGAGQVRVRPGRRAGQRGPDVPHQGALLVDRADAL